MIWRTEGHNTVVYGDHLQDVEAFLQKGQHTWRARSSEANGRGSEWDLNAGYQGALQLARVGWEEGAARLSRRLWAMPAANTAHAPLRYDVAGFEPDVGRFAAGEPAHMRRRGTRVAHETVVHIVVNGVASAFVGADEYENFGLALAACIDRIEASGRRVELDMLFSAELREGHVSTVGWKVKRAQDHSDPAALAFSVGHPAAFRRLGFGLYEHAPREYELTNYGIPARAKKQALEMLGMPDAIVMEGISKSGGVCRTEGGALTYAMGAINGAVGEAIVQLD